MAFEGCLEDYAFVAQSLLDLYEASFELEWLSMAQALTERMNHLFWDREAGGFFCSSGRDSSVLVRMKEEYDGAEPSGNSIATLNLLRLAEMLDRPAWKQMAERTLTAFSQRLNQHPHLMPQLLVALEFLWQSPVQIVIAGERDDPLTQALVRAVNQRFLPNKVLLLADREVQSQLGAGLRWLAALSPRDNRPTAYVCRNFTCDQPVQAPEALGELLARPGASSG